MANWICEQCGVAFVRDKAGDRPIRFCSQSCYHFWRKQSDIPRGFSPGVEPWNKGKKGIHLSPQSEFKKGMISNHYLPVGTVRERTRQRDGKTRAYIKVGEPSVWKLRCVVVWEKHNGPVPKGVVIHHKDRDTLNDDIDNLEALSRADHLATHRGEFKPKLRIDKGRH